MIHTIHPTRCAFTRGQHKPAANVDSATCTLPGCDYEAGTLCAVLNCPARSGRNKTPSGRDEGDSRGVPFSHGRAPAVEYVSFHALEPAGVPQGFQVLNQSPSPDGAVTFNLINEGIGG